MCHNFTYTILLINLMYKFNWWWFSSVYNSIKIHELKMNFLADKIHYIFFSEESKDYKCLKSPNFG